MGIASEFNVIHKAVVNITRQHHKVLWRFRVLEHVKHGVRRARMGHPVLCIDHQWLAKPGKQSLYDFDELDTKYGRG